LVGVFTVPSTILSLVIDNTNNKELRIAGSYLLRQGLFYPGWYFIGTGSPLLEMRNVIIKAF
jgi:hypothetical protein